MGLRPTDGNENTAVTLSSLEPRWDEKAGPLRKSDKLSSKRTRKVQERTGV